MPTAIIAIHRAVGATSNFLYEIRETEEHFAVHPQGSMITEFHPSGFRDLTVINKQNCIASKSFQEDSQTVEALVAGFDCFLVTDTVTGESEVAVVEQSPPVSSPHTSLTLDHSGLPVPRSESY